MRGRECNGKFQEQSLRVPQFGRHAALIAVTQFGNLELHFADQKLCLEPIRFETPDVPVDARLLALYLNVACLAREPAFVYLLVVSDALVIEAALLLFELRLTL